MKIADLQIGSMCEVTLVVKSAVARETRAKKPYLQVEFYDGVDTISGNYWDWLSGNIPAVNAILDVTAQVTEYNGVKQLNIKGMTTNTTKHLAEFAPSSGADIAAAYQEAYSLLGTVEDDMLRDIAISILEELHNDWLTVPGAVGVHHAYLGGTLIHSLSVAKIAKSMAAAVPEANMDLCIVGAMLHDVGKLFTYQINGVTIEMTDQGKLYDHIFIGAEFVGNFAESHFNIDDYINFKKVELLRHIILSHHGSLDFGSPVPPMCIEAVIVNKADGLDAAAEQIRAAAKKVPSNLKWTDRIYTLGNKNQLTPNYIQTVMSYTEDSFQGE